MIYLAYFVLIFTFAQFLVALFNLFAQTHIPYSGKISGLKLSVLIPVRNEENNIGSLLMDLENIREEDIEVIVFDDQSEDRSASIINDFVERDPRFSMLHSEKLPEGWLGKNYACHSLAHKAKGEYKLFLDADVRISGSLLSDALQYAESTCSDLVSIFPMQNIITPGEWATVPNMNYILVSLLPLILVRKSNYQSLAAANGQFMLFRSSAYKETLPHELFKKNKVEDILIARHFKKTRRTISCLLGDERIMCRMYTGYSDAVNGFSKNIAEFFGGSYLVALSFWMITSLGFLPVLLFLPSYLFFGYVAIYLLTRIEIGLSGRQNIMKNLLFIVPLQLSMGTMIYKSFTNKLLNRFTWKGRSIR